MGILIKTIPISLSRCWRIVKWTCIKYSYRLLGRPRIKSTLDADLVTLGPFDKPCPTPLSITAGDTPFPEEEALHGTTATSELCARVPGSLWVEVDGQGECIRYYGHGLKGGENPQLLVFLGGDLLFTASNGARHIAPSYQSQTPTQIEEAMADWSHQANAPALFLARPGIYGSSGNHHLRREAREIALIDRALDALKSQFGIGAFILAGQSGGGGIMAALLGRRQDIAAAVLSSSLLSVRHATAHWEFQRDIPGRLLRDTRKLYDPIEDVDRIPNDPSPVIYVISDPEDQAVSFNIQLRYVRALREAEREVQHIFAHAPAPAHHVLTGHARLKATRFAGSYGSSVLFSRPSTDPSIVAARSAGVRIERHQIGVKRIVEHPDKRGGGSRDAVAIVDPVPRCGEFEAMRRHQLRAQRQIFGAFGAKTTVGPRGDENSRVGRITGAIARGARRARAPSNSRHIADRASAF